MNSVFVVHVSDNDKGRSVYPNTDGVFLAKEELISGQLSPENDSKVRVSRSKLDQKHLDRIKRKAKFKRSGKL